MAILIIGLMFSSITAAIVSVLSYFGSAQQLQQYIFWGFGSLGNLSWKELGIFFIIYFLGMILSISSVKSLNSLLLGENYAKSLGLNIKKSRLTIIIATSLLAGTITAFAGPIAFIGLAIPHMTRQIFNTSNHKILLPAVFLFGAIVMLFDPIFQGLAISLLGGTIFSTFLTLLAVPLIYYYLERGKHQNKK